MTALELRDTGAGTKRFVGYASVTETPYEVGPYVEIIKRGAFRRTLSESPDVVLLINHTGLPLARSSSGTMSLSEDDTGLRVEADLDATDPEVASLTRKFERGDLNGEMSFAFRVTDQQWNEDRSQRLIRSVTIHRGDVSIVTAGANPATTGGFRGGQFTDEQRRRRAKEIGERVIGGNGRIVSIGGVRAPKATRSAHRLDFTTDARCDFDAMLAAEGISPAVWHRAHPPRPAAAGRIGRRDERAWLDRQRIELIRERESWAAAERRSGR
jgi:HK97 family phage prohead protease